MVKGYLLGQITISEKSQCKLFDSKIGNVTKESGGNYLVKGGLRAVKEVNPSFQRDVLVEIKDIKTAQHFFSSRLFKQISKFRKSGSSSFLILVEGKLNS